MSDSYAELTSAALVALDLDAAKQFFGHRDDAARLEFVKSQAAERSLDLSKTWRALQACLGDQPPLGMCLLGGRQMQRSGPAIVSLLRPDMVPAVADALAALDASFVSDQFDSLSEPIRATATKEQVQQSLEELQECFRQAASEQAASVFAAWK